MTAVIQAIHGNVVIITQNTSMDADFDSQIIEWRDMTVGSLQAIWSGHTPGGGYFMAYGSNSRDAATFDDVGCSRFDVTTAAGGKLWNLGLIGYRYGFVKWFKESSSGGTATVVAVGKKR